MKALLPLMLGAWVITIASCGGSSGRTAAIEPAAAEPEPSIALPLTKRSGAITVTVDPRVELMGILCNLAGFNEYLGGATGFYHKAVAERFSPFVDHPAVTTLKRLRTSHGISYNAPMCLAVHLDPLTFRPRVTFDPFPARLDSRWLGVPIELLLAEILDFKLRSQFDDFYISQRQYYDTLLTRTYADIHNCGIERWMASYFGGYDGITLKVIVSELIGNNNFGCSVAGADGSVEMTPVVCLGAPPEIIVHEFSHGFANEPLADEWPSIAPKFEALFSTVRKAMAAQAYGDAQSFMLECITRANTAVYINDMFGEYRLATEFSILESRSFGLVKPIFDFIIAARKNSSGEWNFKDNHEALIHFLINEL